MTTKTLSRRGLLQGAAAAVAASSVAADAAFSSDSLSSPEFAEWQRLALMTRDWFASEEYQRATDRESEARIDPLWDRMKELEAAIFNKPFANDIDGIMMLGVIALYWNDGTMPGHVFLDGNISGLEPDESIDNKSSAYLIRAVCMLAKATGQFPALADSNFDLPLDA